MIKIKLNKFYKHPHFIIKITGVWNSLDPKLNETYDFEIISPKTEWYDYRFDKNTTFHSELTELTDKDKIKVL